jgi:hypothetical protein
VAVARSLNAFDLLRDAAARGLVGLRRLVVEDERLASGEMPLNAGRGLAEVLQSGLDDSSGDEAA